MATNSISGTIRKLYYHSESILTDETKTQIHLFLQMKNNELWKYGRKLLASMHKKYVEAMDSAFEHFNSFPKELFDCFYENNDWLDAIETASYSVYAKPNNDEAFKQIEEAHNQLMEDLQKTDPLSYFERKKVVEEIEIEDRQRREISAYIKPMLMNAVNEIATMNDISGQTIAFFLEVITGHFE